jgi:hypothetical protein
MTYRTSKPSARFFGAHGQLAMLVALTGLWARCGGAAAQPHILKWDIQATVYSITDPHNVFPDLRLGDNVRATMAYNVNANRLWDDFFFGTAYYFLGATFPVTEMVIENPRTGVDLEFKRDEAGDESAVYLEQYKGPPGDDADYFYTSQPVLVPVPLPGGIGDAFGTPSLEVFLKGPPGTLAGPQLPLELNLDDWPGVADISFYDNWVYDISDTRIEASIYSLSPVPFETIPGDFDADGVADERDYAIWRRTFGHSEAREDAIDADADGSGEIDAADYVVWRHAVSSAAINTGSAGTTAVAVPEPATLTLLVPILAAFLHQRRIRHRPLIPCARPRHLPE